MNNPLFLMLAFIALLYFMMIRPQQKQQKKRREMLENLRKGDDIITIGGIQGVIKALRDDKITIEVAKGVSIVVLKTAIGQVLSSEEAEVKEETAEESEKE